MRLEQANRPHVRGSLVNAIAFGVHRVTFNHDRAAGARMLNRAIQQVVHQPPAPESHSHPVRWEIYLNKWNAEAGEDIRYLPRDVADRLHLPAYDFWIFDNTTVAFMVFATSGEFTGPVVVTDQAVTRQHLAYQDRAWQAALPYDRYRPQQ